MSADNGRHQLAFDSYESPCSVAELLAIWLSRSVAYNLRVPCYAIEHDVSAIARISEALFGTESAKEEAIRFLRTSDSSNAGCALVSFVTRMVAHKVYFNVHGMRRTLCIMYYLTAPPCGASPAFFAIARTTVTRRSHKALHLYGGGGFELSVGAKSRQTLRNRGQEKVALAASLIKAILSRVNCVEVRRSDRYFAKRFHATAPQNLVREEGGI